MAAAGRAAATPATTAAAAATATAVARAARAAAREGAAAVMDAAAIAKTAAAIMESATASVMVAEMVEATSANGEVAVKSGSKEIGIAVIERVAALSATGFPTNKELFC